MWQTFYLWGQAMWRKSLRIAVTRRKLSNCFVFAAGRILSSHLLSSVNFCGRLKKNQHSYIDHLVGCPSDKVLTVSGLLSGCVLLHLRAAALFGPASADLADWGLLADTQVGTLCLKQKLKNQQEIFLIALFDFLLPPLIAQIACLT